MDTHLIDELAHIRQFAGLSDSELSDLFDTTPDAVRGWFHGDHIPDETAVRIRSVSDVVRSSAASPTHLGEARRLTEPRAELDGRSTLRAAADKGLDPARKRDPFEEAARRALEEGSETSGLPSEAGLSPGAGKTPDSTTRVESTGVDDDIPAHPSLGPPPRREHGDDGHDGS